MSAVITPTGSSSGAITVRASSVARDEERRAEERRRRQHEPVIGADHQPHQVRNDDADEADRAADRDGGAGGERRAEERGALRARHVEAAALRASGPRLSRFSGRASQAKIANETTTSGSAAMSGCSC